MTIREFYLSVIDLADTGAATDPSMTFGGQSVVDVANKAHELLEKHDASNEKRKSTDTKDKLEAQARREAVLNFFKSNPNEVVDRDSIAAQLGITPAQVTAACKPWVEAGVVTKSEGKVGKSRKVLYSLAS